ncbi:MAG: hypothetical protein ACFFCM_12650 [Promethearchaeota archaeon]
MVRTGRGCLEVIWEIIMETTVQRAWLMPITSPEQDMVVTPGSTRMTPSGSLGGMDSTITLLGVLTIYGNLMARTGRGCPERI